MKHLQIMLRRLHDISSRSVWGVIASIVVVCATDGFNVVARSNFQKQCFFNEGLDAQEACRSYVEEIRSYPSEIINLCLKLEKQKFFENAVVVCQQGLRYHPNNTELLRILQRAENNQNEATRPSNTVPDTGTRASRLAEIACLRLQGHRALESCQRAIKLDPDNAALYKRVGDVTMALGRRAEAEEAYRKARQLGLANAGSTGSAHATAQPNQDVPLRPSTETTPSASAVDSTPSGKASVSSSSVGSKTLLVQLQLLDRLREEGFISVEEHRERKVKLLDEVFKAQPISTPEQIILTNNDRKLIEDVNLGNFYALVIGNNDYQNIPKLKSAIADANAVGTLLENEYDFRVTRLIDANRYQILSALSRFRSSLSERDSFLIYYAGHGVLDKNIQRGYWLPIDAEADNYANWLSTTELIDQVNGMRALHVLVVADSCFSGALVRGVLPGFDQTGSRTNADYHALIRRLAEKRSRTILTAGGLEPVLDSGGGIHSVFAKAFLNILRENQGIIEGTKLFQKLRELVVYNADQTPEYAPIQKAGHEGGDFIFIRKP